MIVVTLRGTESFAESQVVAELSDWTGNYRLSGIVLVQPLMATQGTHSMPDALLITPRATITLEVKGLTFDHRGEMRTPVNGRWTASSGDESPLDLLPAGARDLNPLGQATRHKVALRI